MHHHYQRKGLVCTYSRFIRTALRGRDEVALFETELFLESLVPMSGVVWALRVRLLNCLELGLGGSNSLVGLQGYFAEFPLTVYLAGTNP